MSRAIGTSAAIAICAVVTVIAPGRSAGAQSPAPSASSAPRGFSAHAHGNVSASAQGTTFTGSLQLGVAQRANLTRIDVLSVKSDTIPLPPITVTAVIDRGAKTLTVWNDATKQYKVQALPWRVDASASPRPSATPQPSPRPERASRPSRSILADLDVLALTLKLAGHTTTSGLPTTGLALDFEVQRKGDKAVSHVTATTQLADDYAIFPMTLDVSIEPGMVPYSAKLAYAVDDLTPGMPPLERFKVPAGYTEARTLSAVIFGRTSTPGWMPKAAPTPH